MIKIEKMKQNIVKILKRYNVARAGIFGSYARGEQKKDSDIDILISFDGSLLRLVQIERELKEKLGKNVDLLTYDGISPLLKKKVLREEIKII